MKKELVLATGNAGKVREFNQLLADFPVSVRPQSDFNVPEAEETGTTFVENAIIKARNAARHTGLGAIADDSGLAVDALNGEPGVYSSRYAGQDATDSDNVDKLIDALRDVPEQHRTAKFFCVIVFMRYAQDPSPIICQGEWYGHITQSRQGEGGFGYDPIFWVSSQHLTAAQLPAAIKNRISHRAKAFQVLIEKCQHELSGTL